MRSVCISTAMVLIATSAGAQSALSERVRTAQAAIRATSTDDSPTAAVKQLSVWLADPDPTLKQASLQAIAGRVYRARLVEGREAKPSEMDSAVLASISPVIEALRLDADERVRADAISTWVLLGTQKTDRQNQYAVRPHVAAWLEEAYHREPVPEVRLRMIHPLALIDATTAGPTATIANRLVLAALDDPNKEVLKVAIQGVATKGLKQGYDRIASLLSHESSRVRIVAAQVMPKVDGGSGRYQVQLESALSTETDEMTRVTMDAALKALKQKRR